MADPRVQPVYGICSNCGAVAWELLLDKSDCCLGCDPFAYREDEDDLWDEEDDDFDDR